MTFALETKLSGWALHTAQPHWKNFFSSNFNANAQLSEHCTYSNTVYGTPLKERKLSPFWNGKNFSATMLSLPCCPQLRNFLTPKTPPQTLPWALWKSSHFKKRRFWLLSVIILNTFFCMITDTIFLAHPWLLGKLESVLLSAYIFEIATTIAVFLLACELQLIIDKHSITFHIKPHQSLFHNAYCLLGHIMLMCLHSETHGTKEMKCINSTRKITEYIRAVHHYKIQQCHLGIQTAWRNKPKVQRKVLDFINSFFFLFWLMGRDQGDSSGSFRGHRCKVY